MFDKSEFTWMRWHCSKKTQEEDCTSGCAIGCILKIILCKDKKYSQQPGSWM